MKLVGYLIGGLWLTATASAVTLSRGPYVMMGHFTNQTTLVWRTDVNADSWVDYGLTPTLGSTTGTGNSVLQHEVTLTGLQPGTNYYYRVRSTGVVSATNNFASGKLPGTPFRIALSGDHRGGGGGVIGTQIGAVLPDLFADCGDIEDTCNFADLDVDFFSKFAPALKHTPVYWTPGNHEGNNCSYCLEAFDTLPEDHQSYAIEYGDLLLVSLNSEGLPGTSWLENKLTNSSAPWKIVQFHQPARTASGGTSAHPENATIRDQYVPIMEKYHVDLCSTGHNHFYWRSQPINGITHMVVGSGGAPRYNATVFPCYTAAFNSNVNIFAYADISGDQMYVHSIDENGNQVDETFIDHTCRFQVDGLLDTNAVVQVANRPGGMSIWAAVAGRYLYVATQDAGEGNDNFILLARTLTGTTTNLWSWNKAGTVMAYDAFLADENDNTFSGWFKSDGTAFNNIRTARSATQWCNGYHLEGVIDLLALYGTIPPVIYLAAAPYGTANGGTLVAAAQCPTGNGDGNIDSNEFVAVPVANIIDENRDGVLDVLDPNRGFRAQSVAAETGGVTITWPAVPGHSYQVYAADSLTQQPTPLSGTNTALQADWTLNYTDATAGGAAQRFYRVRHLGP